MVEFPRQGQPSPPTALEGCPPSRIGTPRLDARQSSRQKRRCAWSLPPPSADRKGSEALLRPSPSTLSMPTSHSGAPLPAGLALPEPADGTEGQLRGQLDGHLGAAQVPGALLFAGLATSRQGRGHSSVITLCEGRVLEEYSYQDQTYTPPGNSSPQLYQLQGFVANHTDIFHIHEL